jgi:hypothetical protein
LRKGVSACDDGSRGWYRVDRRRTHRTREGQQHDDGGYEDEGQLQFPAGTHRVDLPRVLLQCEAGPDIGGAEEDRAIRGSRK